MVIALMVFAPLVKIIIQTQTNNVALTMNARQGSLVFLGFAKTTKTLKITTITIIIITMKMITVKGVLMGNWETAVTVRAIAAMGFV